MIEYKVKVFEDVTEWYFNGNLHREDGPAVEWKNGDKCWYKNHQLHREDGPAIEYSHGAKHWYKEGRLHREDGPAKEHSDGAKEWYVNGQRHREDGPAIEDNGCEAWYLFGKSFNSKEDVLAEKARFRTRIHEQVKAFHEAGGLPIKTVPEVPADDRVNLRVRLIVEEFTEMLQSLFRSDEMVRTGLSNARDVIYNILKEHKFDVDIVEFADALGDLDYVIEGARLEFGINGRPIMDEIQRTNMAKFGPGSWKDENGKIRKPPNWLPPDIAGELKKQGWKE